MKYSNLTPGIKCVQNPWIFFVPSGDEPIENIWKKEGLHKKLGSCLDELLFYHTKADKLDFLPMMSSNTLWCLTKLLPTSVGVEAKASFLLRKVFMADCCSVNAKMQSSFDKTATIALSTLISSAATISYKLVVTTVCSFSHKIHWKCFGLKLFKMDEWDFSLEISGIHLHCRVRKSPCDVPSEVFWHLILLIF